MDRQDRLEQFARIMLIERVAVGALVALAPRTTLRIFGTPAGVDTPTLRYVGRLFGIRNALLGILLWQARKDPRRLEELATVNAATEALDAVAGAVPLVRRQGMDRAAASAVATSLTVMTGFLRLRALARSADVNPAGG
jgi:hypothetical protein